MDNNSSSPGTSSYSEQHEDPNIYTDLFPEDHYEDASKGMRFVNYLIDSIAFYIFLFITGLILGLLEMTSVIQWMDEIASNVIADYLFTGAMFFVFMTLVEGISKGRSFGKLVTGTSVLREDGSAISFQDAALRSISRVVPLEVLSIFFGHRPWHDLWTNTMVVKKQRL